MSEPTLLAIDPGTKPGIVHLASGGQVLDISHTLDAPWIRLHTWDLVVTEEQWMFHDSGKRGADGRRQQVNPNSLFKLAFRAGFTLASIPARRRMALSPQVWRGDSKLTKEQMQARIAQQLTAEERKLFAPIPKSRHGDVLDAIGIGRAALRIAPTTTKYDWRI